MISPLDIRTDVFTAGVSCPVHVRLTHIPTGVVAEATDLSRTKATQRALQNLSEQVPTD